MKYITKYKLFESSNKPYEEITTDEFNLKVSGLFDPEYDMESDDFEPRKFERDHYVSFTNFEIEELKKLLPDIEIMDADSIIKQSQLHSIEDQVIVVKLKDDWIYAILSDYEEDSKYYKCDQFDGLIQLINDYVV